MPKYCASCGAELTKQSKFCPSCGAEKAASQPAQPQPQQPLQSQQPVQPQSVQQAMPIPPPKKSKTKLIALITIIVAVIVVVVVLFFVLFQNDAANFVGTWNIEYLAGSSNPTGEWTFYDNGTLNIEQGSNPDIWNNYEIINGKICLSSHEYSYYHCYDYEFTNGGTSLTLSADGTTSVGLKK